jgi:hypothetical protein
MAVALVAAVTIAPTAASASRGPVHYPPPPPQLTVDHGVVKHGASVRATGRKFSGRERVSITVSFRPRGSSRWRTVKTAAVRADRDGHFSINVRMYAPGYVAIKAYGSSSRKSAAAYVYVVDGRRGHGGSWSIRPAAYPASTEAAAPQPDHSGSGLIVAGLGLLALAGSTLITYRVTHRRKA